MVNDCQLFNNGNVVFIRIVVACLAAHRGIANQGGLPELSRLKCLKLLRVSPGVNYKFMRCPVR